jgi:histidinol dehydrogenase
MARGWESKSVEAQMEEVKDVQPSGKRSLTDGEKKDQRERDNLKLSRAYVAQQIEAASNEKYKESLRQALQEIDQKLAKLGSTR